MNHEKFKQHALEIHSARLEKGSIITIVLITGSVSNGFNWRCRIDEEICES